MARSAPRLPREAVVVADPAGDLPHARKEGAAVDKALAGFGVRRLTGSEATRVAVLGALDGAPVFHFAGHGVLRPAQPWDAHLRLAGGEALSLADVLSARPALGVVVLSGCDTAAVSVSGRDDLVGLPEALLASGARSVVATVREVPDEAARRFVARFYAADGARRPAHALRAAAKAAGGTAGSVHASFRLFGRR